MGYEDWRHDDPFEGQMKKVTTAFAVWFAVCALVALGMLGLGAWALVELVQWVVAQ